jgi:hypothetical protein
MSERTPSPRRRTPAVKLDETAKRIIEQLQQDGRRSYTAIGKAVGLTEIDHVVITAGSFDILLTCRPPCPFPRTCPFPVKR